MTAIVFAGPTISRDEVRGLSEAVCLPPVGQGDVYRAAQSRPRAIGIIDGYFEGVPSVWHKEILWAMSRGIHVFGSASMGALRAAELHDFGMVGVGQIFQDYRDGALDDDDEVAVLHGPPETGYVALSESMVNIRATLDRAEGEEIIAAETHRELEAIAKSLFYQERTWDALLDQPEVETLAQGERVALRAWLPEGRVDVKSADARAMVAAMQEFLSTAPEAKSVAYTFEWTEMWDNVTAVLPGGAAEPEDALPGERLLDELRLEGEPFQSANRRALLRLLALRESDRSRRSPPRRAVSHALNKFRAERGLFSRADVDRWLAENDISAATLERLMEEEARLSEIESLAGPAVARHVIADLRLVGDYPRLVARARRKERTLAAGGFDDPVPGHVGPAPAQLLAWYFETRLGRPIPENLEDFCRDLGFVGTAEFYRALLREYLYLSCNAESAEGANSEPAE